MSFIVKGIDIPKDETIVIHYANRYGEMETVFVDENDIIQIPKGHGRLIDGDKLKLARHDIYVEEINYRHRCIHIENIDEAPTILEAEE